MGATDVTPLDGFMDPFSREMVAMAREFDNLSETIIDKNMCTPNCPCYIAPRDSWGNTTHLAMMKYGSVSEPYLNLRGRTWNQTTRGNSSHVPFYWTTNVTLGYKTFEECLHAHFKDSMTQTELYEVARKFKISHKEMTELNHLLGKEDLIQMPDIPAAQRERTKYVSY